MKQFIRAFGHQIADYVLVRRMLIMLLMLLSLSWVSMDIYHRMVVQDIPIAILDFDQSKLSRTIQTFVSSTREVRIVRTPIESVEDARTLLEQGQIAAVLLIPGDFSSDIKQGRKGRVVLAIDMSNIVIGKNVYKALAKSIGTVAAGAQLTMVKKLGERKNQALSRVVPIVIDESLAYNPATNYAVYVAPGLVFFLLHVFVLIAAASLFLPDNKYQGAIARSGSAMATFVLSIAVGLLFFYVYLPHQDITPQASFGVALCALACLVGVDILMAAAFASAIPNPLTALQVTVVFGMLSLMLSGLTWPTDMFPKPLQFVSEVTPFTPFAKAMRQFLHFPTAMSDLHPLFRAFGMQALAFGCVFASATSVRKLVGMRRRRVSC